LQEEKFQKGRKNRKFTIYGHGFSRFSTDSIHYYIIAPPKQRLVAFLGVFWGAAKKKHGELSLPMP
jgi:hypothetical protein